MEVFIPMWVIYAIIAIAIIIVLAFTALGVWFFIAMSGFKWGN